MRRNRQKEKTPDASVHISPSIPGMEHCMATGIERSGVKRIRLHDLRHSHARNRRVFLPTGIKRWTESEKYGKISIRNDIVKSEFIKEDMDETVFMFALFKCRKFDKRRN